jgi:CheY-like chemotaxis protein
VDDNEDAARSLAQLLDLEGHATQVAYTAHAALDQYQNFKPDVVLLDIGLPEMDGYEVAHRLRQRGDLEGVILVALTGYGQREDRDRAIAAGFDEHLVKPVGFDELQRLLSNGATPSASRA